MAEEHRLKKHRWQKGCASPNPTGQTRTKDAAQIVRTILEEVDPKQRRTNLETLFRLWFRRAKQGDTKKGELLLAYAFGKPRQSVEIEGNALQTLQVVHVGMNNADPKVNTGSE